MSGIVLLILRAALTLMLYAFLGWALWLIWRTLKWQQTEWNHHRVSPLHLKLSIGDEEHSLNFSLSEITIGRDPHCECVIDSKTVSAHHARLNFHHGQWWVEDLGSTNGTVLNQETVSTATVITPGDLLRCGEATLSLLHPDHPPEE